MPDPRPRLAEIDRKLGESLDWRVVLRAAAEDYVAHGDRGERVDLHPPNALLLLDFAAAFPAITAALREAVEGLEEAGRCLTHGGSTGDAVAVLISAITRVSELVDLTPA